MRKGMSKSQLQQLDKLLDLAVFTGNVPKRLAHVSNLALSHAIQKIAVDLYKQGYSVDSIARTLNLKTPTLSKFLRDCSVSPGSKSFGIKKRRQKFGISR